MVPKCSVSAFAAPAFVVLVLSGCGAGTRLDESSTAVRVASALPPPDSPVQAVDVAPYRIVPGDEINISVFGAPELDRTGTIVDAAGNISLPLAGTVTVAGKTPEEVAAHIEAKLRGPYLKNPRVAVNVKQTTAQQTVTVDGEVEQPGVYPVLSRMTLQQAIATARGASEMANIRNVIVFRTVNGQKMAAMFDLKDIRSGRYPDPQIYGNDIVVVGESAVQKFLRSATAGFPVLGRFIPVIL
jgi:polysaccharide biosynthesis/export protein